MRNPIVHLGALSIKPMTRAQFFLFVAILFSGEEVCGSPLFLTNKSATFQYGKLHIRWCIHLQ